MALTIELPPQEVQEVRGYALLEGVTVDALLLRCLRSELSRYRQKSEQSGTFAKRWRAVVARGNGRLDSPYKFNRADAYAEGKFA